VVLNDLVTSNIRPTNRPIRGSWDCSQGLQREPVRAGTSTFDPAIEDWGQRKEKAIADEESKRND